MHFTSLRKCALLGRLSLTFWALAISAFWGRAQQPDTLRYSVPPPAIPALGNQAGAWLGYDVAADGGIIAAGAIHEDLNSRDDSGSVRIFDATTGSLLHVLKNPNPERSREFGKVLGVSGTRVVVGNTTDFSGPSENGRAYVYDLSSATPTVPKFVLDNPTPGFNSFGIKVAISGQWVAVGAPHSGGRIHIYDLSTATPTVPVLTLSNPFPLDFIYGKYFSLSGSRLAISALVYHTGKGGRIWVHDLASATPLTPVWSITNADVGFHNITMDGNSIATTVRGTLSSIYTLDQVNRVFVYDTSKAVPYIATLTSPHPADLLLGVDSFGVNLAVSGTRIAVSSSYASYFRYAYVYDVAGQDPNLPLATLSRPASSNFGYAVAFSNERLVVGAPSDSAVASSAGAAYIYDLASPALPTLVLTSPAATPSSALFGYSVSLSGTWMMVGAYGESIGGSASGMAYAYDLSSPTPTEPRFVLNNPSPAVSDYFGGAVAVSGGRAAVGAPNDDTAASDAGSVYVYDFNGPTPTAPACTILGPNLPSKHFGTAVALSGTKLAVGSFGTVYVYQLAELTGAAPPVPEAILMQPAGSSDFGLNVAISGNIVVVGARTDDTGATDAGSVYVYDLAGATPSVPMLTLHNPTPAVDDRFGFSVAISGQRIAVGAYHGDHAVLNAGGIYIYDLGSPTPATPILTLSSPTPSAVDLFGWSVGFSGNRVAVGAVGDDTDAEDTGMVFVFDLDSATPKIPVARLRNPTPDTNDSFGQAVVIDGTTVAVGTHVDATAGFRRGYAYVFTPDNLDADGNGLPDNWERVNYGAVGGGSSPDDPHQPAPAALLKYAFGRDSNVIDSSAGGLTRVEDGYLTMTILKRPGLSYVVQSGDLPNAASFNSATTTILIEDANTLIVRDNVSIDAQPTRVMRVKVSITP